MRERSNFIQVPPPTQTTFKSFLFTVLPPTYTPRPFTKFLCSRLRRRPRSLPTPFPNHHLSTISAPINTPRYHHFLSKQFSTHSTVNCHQQLCSRFRQKICMALALDCDRLSIRPVSDWDSQCRRWPRFLSSSINVWLIFKIAWTSIFLLSFKCPISLPE